MALEIRVPRLGWSMEEGTFLRWLKRDGDRVQVGDTLYELEGDKAMQEIESLDRGTLRIAPDAPAPGAVVAVGTLLGYLVAEGEPVPFASKTTLPGAGKIAAPSPATEPQRMPPAAPSVRRLARELGVELAQVAGSEPSGRITAADVRQALRTERSAVHEANPRKTSRTSDRSSPEPSHASPRARRLAAELSIDWREVRGTGRTGRIRERDVRAVAATLDERRTTVAAPVGADSSLPITPRRRALAERMLDSRQQTAPVTLTRRADATNLVNLRNQFGAVAGSSLVPSYTDIVAKLTAIVLSQHPLLAARWQGDRLILPDSDHIHLGIAVDTEDGLLVPVLREVPQLSLMQLAQRSLELIHRARARQLTSVEMQGGVFTITNLGMFGIDAFSPIINFPETAVLGLGAVRREPVVCDDGQIAARDQITLSLTFDHRVVDGAPAARFLQTLCDALESPSPWLLQDPSAQSLRGR